MRHFLTFVLCHKADITPLREPSYSRCCGLRRSRIRFALRLAVLDWPTVYPGAARIILVKHDLVLALDSYDSPILIDHGLMATDRTADRMLHASTIAPQSGSRVQADWRRANCEWAINFG